MQEKDFVSYEYKTVAVKAKDKTKALDMYEAFGWEATATEPSVSGGVTLSLRRDRKQKHKSELIKLERQAKSMFDFIGSMESSKTLGASIFAYIFGVIGALVLGGGMCLVMLVTGNVAAFVGGIVLGAAGILLCCINYPVYKKLVIRKTNQVLPIIDDSEEKLANILEKGNELLVAEKI